MPTSRNKTLIITPTGCDMFFDAAYDGSQHWRFTKPGRSYEVAVVAYKDDYTPPEGTYDYLIRHKGMKWPMLPDVLKHLQETGVDWQEYETIGYWDDDYCTDIPSLETALHIGRHRDLRVYQQSLISHTVFPPLVHNPAWCLSEVNHIELGVPLFRNDIFRRMVQFIEDYKPTKTEWGVDKVFCYYLGQTAHVIHQSHIKHCRPETVSYDKADGFRDMEYIMRDWFPKYMKEKFGKEYIYNDQQIILRAWDR